MMNLVLFSWFTTTDIFHGITDIDMKTLLYKEQLQAIQDDMLPFGVFSNDENSTKEVDNEGNVWMEVNKHQGLY
jgi:hypothetical protein